jgi:hypothetical protein
VVWRRDDAAGCAFDYPLSPDDLDITLTAHTLVAAHFGSDAERSGPHVQRLRFRQRTGAIILGAIAAWGVLLAAASLLMRALGG